MTDDPHATGSRAAKIDQAINDASEKMREYGEEQVPELRATRSRVRHYHCRDCGARYEAGWIHVCLPKPHATPDRAAKLDDLLEIARQIRQIAEMDEAWPVDNFAMACAAIRVLYGEAEMTRLIDEAFAKGRENG